MAAFEDRQDERWMAAVAAGDLRALAFLFERHHAGVWRFIRRMTGSRDAADELTQDVFLRVLRYRASYEPGRAFTAWLYRIARNVLSDQAGRRSPDIEPATEPDTTPVDAPSPAAALEASEDRARLEAALQRLDPAQREILVLARFQERSHREIAELLGCSVGAVKLRVFRALRRLEALLEGDHVDAR